VALALGGGTPWSIWWLGVVWIAATATALFLTLRRIAGLLPAAIASAVFIGTLHHPDYYQGGNLTEVYALLPQVLTLGAAARFIETRRGRWVAALGALTAAAFLFKPTYIVLGACGLVVALVLDLGSGARLTAARHLGLYALGLVAFLGPVIAYFVARRALVDLWDAVIVYDFVYAQSGLTFRSLFTTMQTLAVQQPMASVFAASVATLTVAATRVIRSIRDRGVHAAHNGGLATLPLDPAWLLAPALLATPFEWIQTGISGRNFGHYFMTPLPAMAACIAVLVVEVRSALKSGAALHPSVLLFAFTGALALAWGLEVAFSDLPRPSELALLQEGGLGGSYQISQLEQFILAHSEPNQSVLVWGIHPNINFTTGRRSPSRYLFATQLLLPGTGNEARMAEFLSDLKRDRPVLILAQIDSPVGVPFFASKAQMECPSCSPGLRTELGELKAFVDQHYRPTANFGDWVIYGLQS
jgi:hypothetical protein